MGDVTYPGLQLFRVSEHVTEAQILEAILQIFGDGKIKLQRDKSAFGPKILASSKRPQYRSDKRFHVEDYLRSGNAAAVSEYRKEYRDLAAQRQNGRVFFTAFLEADQQLKECHFTIIFRTMKTAVWCKEKAGGIDSVTIVPPAEGVSFEDLAPVDDLLHYGQSHLWYSGQVFDVKDSSVEGFVDVSTVVVGPINKMLRLERDSTYHLIPHSPPTLKKELRKHLKGWFKFESDRELTMLRGQVEAARYFCHVDNNDQLEQVCFWTVEVTVPFRQYPVFEDEDTVKQYEGVDLYILVHQVDPDQSTGEQKEHFRKKFYRNRFQVDIDVIRMMSKMHEKLDPRQNPVLAGHDKDLLHVRVLQSPNWLFDQGLREINGIAERDGYARLTEADRQSLRDHIDFIALGHLKNANVIVFTVACAQDLRLQKIKLKLLDDENKFTALLSDEASLLTIPNTMPLLTLGFHLVLVMGDVLKLPPVIKCESAKHACLDVCWMQMLPLTMAEEVRSVVSYYTYQGRVGSSDEVHTRDYANDPRHGTLFEHLPKLIGQNIALYSYTGYHDAYDAESSSKWNPREVNIVEHPFRKLLIGDVDMQNVVVIVMYDLQVRRLNETITGMGDDFQNVTIASVDSFEGNESDVGILSTVRKNSRHDIGFMRDARRINVAISRARDYLLIVGNFGTLHGSGVPTFTDLFNLLDHRENEGKIIESFTPMSGSRKTVPSGKTLTTSLGKPKKPSGKQCPVNFLKAKKKRRFHPGTVGLRAKKREAEDER
ncbi:unnamed protein product [Orchesella dallaii]|uniref:DNA2/NAM7 helicase-like C-terminal domain-containing protein n=1 Tax=Orchesella dallaii TaxID=48710 RepID=A0ABP1Q1V1_9HEXA